MFDIHDTVFLVDATAPGSPALRNLKTYLGDMKTRLTQVILFLFFVMCDLLIIIDKCIYLCFFA